MYTVVLMAALTSGSATPDWHPRGQGHVHAGGIYSCLGCYGAGGASGGFGVPYGGTCIGTWGGYTMSGPTAQYGCWGGWSSNRDLTVYTGPGTYGYGYGHNGGNIVNYGNTGPYYGISFQCHGCYGCYGGWSCFGSPSSVAGYGLPYSSGPVPPVVVVPGTSPIAPQPLPNKEGAMLRSTVIIEVPGNAKLYVDDNLMKGTESQRVFQTPPLNADETYFYDIRVETMVNGRVSTDRQRIMIHPGETVSAAFRENARPEVVTVRNAAQAP